MTKVPGRNPLISELLVTRNLLLRPVELGSVDPYAVQNYRELARDGNCGLRYLWCREPELVRWRGQCMAPWASPENAHIA
jgi:hypothetical protein